MVSVLTLSVVDRGLESQYNGKCAHLECDRSWVGVPVSVLTLNVLDRGLEPQYNGKCAHLECVRSWVGAPV